MWLLVVRSNNDPVVPASLFLTNVLKLKVCPNLLRTDHGTETGIMATIQCVLQQDVKAHRFGTSVTNQRIENWWSHCKAGYTAWVINFFKDLVNDGTFILGNHVHMECAWFVFSDFIQEDLNDVIKRWNTHYIRKSKCSIVGGIPNELFYLPEKTGYSNCGKSITRSDIDSILQQRNVFQESEYILSSHDEDLSDYFQYVILNENLPFPPRDWDEAKFTFVNIISKL